MNLEKTIKKYNMLSGGERVICALSGGADSVVLTHWLANNAKQLNISVAAAHFSHGIRKEVAEQERNMCAELCSSLGIDLYCGEGDSVSYAKQYKVGIEEAARKLRYSFLNRIANEFGADKIATAHHADDNVETVILNVCRGAGITGISGIPPVRDRFIRPLIEIEKNEVLKYIEDNKLVFATDVTNFELCCERNRIRLAVLPEMRKAYPNINEVLSRFSYQAYIRKNEINCKAENIVSDCLTRGNELIIPVDSIRNAEESVEARVVQILHRRAGGKSMLSSRHIEAVRKITDGDDPSAKVYLPEITVRREYEYLIFSKPVLKQEELPKIIEIGQKITFGFWEVELISGKHPLALWINGTKISGQLVLRSRKEGDFIFLAGHNKSLKKLMIDKKIPREQRMLYPVLVDQGNIIAVADLGVNDNYRCKTENNIVSVIFRRVKDEQYEK